MAAERKTLVEETSEAMEWVSPSSHALIQGLIESAKKRSREGLVIGCHRAIQKILILEIIISLFQLILDLQKIILDKIRDHDFKAWYQIMVTRDRRYYEIYDIWGSRVCFPSNSGVAALSVHAHPREWIAPYVTEHYRAWDYGMVCDIRPFPTPNDTFFSKLTKFQKYIFRRAYHFVTQNSFPQNVYVQCAGIEVVEGKVNPPHYLIMIGGVSRGIKDPICIQQKRVTNPTEARALGFFYIVQYLDQFSTRSDKPPVIIHVGNTTMVAPAEIRPYVEEGIANGESIIDYIENIESGNFLSPRGQEYMFETFMTWDEAYAARTVQEYCIENDITEDSIYENWENNIGDEGMQNMMMD